MLKLIVITDAAQPPNELETIINLFEAGLQYLHVRKPDYNYRQMHALVNSIPEKYRSRLVLHSHHALVSKYKLGGMHLTESARTLSPLAWIRVKLYRMLMPKMSVSTSFHRLNDLRKESKKYSYVLLSPVFDSISKKDYTPSYSMGAISKTLEETKQKVIALGGIDASKVNLCRQAGFKGVALLGGIWQSERPVEEFKKVQEKCTEEVLFQY